MAEETEIMGEENLDVSTAALMDMSESDKVIKYCLENHIDKTVIDEILTRGYTSLAAFKLMDASDLQSPMIPKGQQRLLLHIEKALTTSESESVERPPNKRYTSHRK